MENATTVQVSQDKTSGLAIASLVLGIISVLGGAMFILPSILAVVFGHVGMGKIKKDPNMSGKGMAIAGLVMGWLGLAGWIVFVLLFGGLAAIGATSSY